MVAVPITRLRGIYARHGLWGALGLIPSSARTALRAWSPRRRQARRQELAFDRRHGIDTATPTALSSLGVDGASLRHAVEYKPSGIDFIRAIIGGLGIAYEDYEFIDLGSGKGRALLLASHLPFARIVGVEFSAKLVAVARANIAAYRPPDQRCRRIDVICGDAAAVALPERPLVIYLYNPFDDVILGRVADRLAASLAQSPRALWLIYVNPVHRNVLDRLDCLEIADDRSDIVIYRSRTPA
jgi:SAM-dependent methyltransferase